MIVFHRESVRVEIENEPADGEVLFAIRIDGLVTWAELEALAWQLHPAGLSAQAHAQMVMAATKDWRRGEDPLNYDDDEDPEYQASLQQVFPLVDADGMHHDEADYVACPTCAARPGDMCLDVEEPHLERREAFRKWLTDPANRFGGQSG